MHFKHWIVLNIWISSFFPCSVAIFLPMDPWTSKSELELGETSDVWKTRWHSSKASCWDALEDLWLGRMTEAAQRWLLQSKLNVNLSVCTIVSQNPHLCLLICELRSADLVISCCVKSVLSVRTFTSSVRVAFTEVARVMHSFHSYTSSNCSGPKKTKALSPGYFSNLVTIIPSGVESRRMPNKHITSLPFRFTGVWKI